MLQASFNHIRASYSVWLVVVLLAIPLTAADFYVSPTGSSSGNGSITSPWDLQTALYQPAAVRPGDTIFLRGGTYQGHFESRLNGTAISPITVRTYAGERAILDGAQIDTQRWNHQISAGGSYAWFRDFEVTNTNPARERRDRPTGVVVSGSNIKLINLYIHDTGQGISGAPAQRDTELYGNIVLYNGNYPPENDGGYGHGMYVQNTNGTLRIIDNMVFNQFGYGVQAYGSGNAYLRNIWLEGNTIFNNGVACVQGSAMGARNIIVGGGVPAENPTLIGNYTYYTPGTLRAGNLNMGYMNGATAITMTGNYFVADTALQMDCRLQPCTYASVSGNTIWGGYFNLVGAAPALPAGNTVANPPTTGTHVFVRPNRYEAGRANITIYNFGQSPTVSVNVSGILQSGDNYVVKDVQNWFGPPVAQGTYSSTPITIPMSLTTVTPAVNGSFVPVHTGPRFGAFVLQRTTGGGTTTPPPTTPPPTSPPPPTSTSLVQLHIEAEGGVLSPPMAIVSLATASRGKFITSAIPESGTASYIVNIPSSGTYHVWARVIGTSWAADTTYVAFDAGAEDVFDMTEGTWSQNWQWSRVNGRGGTTRPKTLDPRTFQLAAGRHVLRFRMREAYSMVDKFIITNDPNFRPTN